METDPYEASDLEVESDLNGTEGYEASDVDYMLDSLMEATDDERLEERKRRRGRRGRGGRQVPTAKGGNAYRPPVPQANVTQKQLEDALTRVGTDIRRNAMGIKTINGQIGKLTGQLGDVVAVNRVQNDRLMKLNRQLRIDGALDLAQAITVTAGDDGTTITPNFGNLLKGAVKVGMLGDMRGALGNPLLIGGLGLVLSNPAIIAGLLPRTP